MRIALPSLPSHLPSRRRSRRSRALAAGRGALPSGFVLRALGGAVRRTRAAVAFPLLSFGAVILFLRKRLRSRREGGFDQAVDAPAAATSAPQAVSADPSPANPETDLPAAPNGSASTDEARETAKAAVAGVDPPNDGAPGHDAS